MNTGVAMSTPLPTAASAHLDRDAERPAALQPPLAAAPLPAAPHPGCGGRILSLEELVVSRNRILEQKFAMLVVVRAGDKIHDWQAKAALYDAELACLDKEIQAERAGERQLRPGGGARILSIHELVVSQIRIREQKYEMLLRDNDWRSKVALFDVELARLDNEIQAKRELQARLVEDARIQKRAAEIARAAREQAQERQMRQWGTRRWGLHQSFSTELPKSI